MKQFKLIVMSICSVLLLWALSTGPAVAQTTDFDKQQALKNYGNLSLRFEANVGQTDPRVKFISRGSGYTMFLTSDEVVMVLSKPVKADALPMMGEEPHKDIEAMKDIDDPEMETTVLRMKLLGSNTVPAVTGLKELPGITNYFIGNDPQKWYTNVLSYAKVEYKEVYKGVDLVYYGNQRQLEFDFVIAPGADPNVIKLDFLGAERLEIDESGDLVIHVEGGELRQHKPVIYQQIDGNRKVVSGGYVLQGGRQVSFEVADYDPDRPLVIDPILSYSTYLGSGSNDGGWSIAVDGSGNAYVTGRTNASNFPTLNPFKGSYGGGYFDAFVTKLNPSGTALVYSTYLGGSSDDRGHAIAVDGSGSAYVTGYTFSTNFPTLNPFQSSYGGGNADIFVTKLDASGSALVYSTYLGGSGGWWDIGYGIAVDGSGNAYVTGQTGSSNFPTANAFQSSIGGNFDVFVTKFDASGSALVYSTYLGGGAWDVGYDIAVDGSGSAYVTGYTGSYNFPTANAIQSSYSASYDVFVTKLNVSGTALVYSTYLGGSCDFWDAGTGIAVDGSGSAYISGYTCSYNFPTVNPFQSSYGGGSYDGFVMKLNPSGSALVYSTYLGGSSDDGASDIAVDGSGSVYVTGTTNSNNFPTTVNALQSYIGGNHDVFITKLGSNQPPIAGTISGTVSVDGNGLESVLVKLLDEFGIPVIGFDDVYTDANGEYSFIDVPAGDYQVMIVEPLGYVSDGDQKTSTVIATETSIVNFNLTEIVVVNQARSKGYWKHQFDVYVRNKGNAQESEQDLNDYIDLVHQHYTLYFDIFTDVNTFPEWQAILSLKGNHPMVDRAKQHLSALILNMVSNKIGQYTVVTDDGRDVGDVIQYVSELIIDPDDTNDELAKDLAESVNNQQMIAAGIVDEGDILFKVSSEVGEVLTYDLENNYPNPFNPSTVIKYQIPNAGFVTLKVYDVLGNEVATLLSENKDSGRYNVTFNASALSSGVYIYQLRVNDYFSTKKMILMK